MSLLDVSTIKELMLACLECRYFVCQGQYYVQIEGAPMGLSLSVVLGINSAKINKDTGKHTISPTWWSVLDTRGHNKGHRIGQQPTRTHTQQETAISQ